jgi:predicted phage baseplate assembly protein
MPLPLPDLDTRAFEDLADEARASIPRYSGRWTDHNLSDPGITATEAVAAEVDQLMYAVNRVTNRDRRTLLNLLGFPPRPPHAAHVVLVFALRGPTGFDIPAGVVFASGDDDILFRTTNAVHVSAAQIVAAQTSDGVAFTDHSRALATGGDFLPLGADPDSSRGPAFLVGLDPPPPAGVRTSLWLRVDRSADPDRIEAELGPAARHAHHDARVVWEYFDGTDWQPIASVDDETRALTAAGAVVLTMMTQPPKTTVGAIASPAAWIRCRLESGRLDAPPRLGGIALHAAEAVQAVPATTRLTIAPGCVVPAGKQPVAGSASPLALDLDTGGRVATITADAALSTPAVDVLDYQAATATTSGRLFATFAVLGRGERTPGQRLVLPEAPVVAESVAVWVSRGVVADPVRLVASLDSAQAHDLVAALAPADGTLVFGDGRRGRMLAGDELVVATYDRTRAAVGNLRAGGETSCSEADDAANVVRLGAGVTPADVDATVSVLTPWPAAGGADAEDIVQAAGRASRRLFAHERLLELLRPGEAATLDGVDPVERSSREAPERATNGVDLERIALDVPGCTVARARTWPALDTRYPGLTADGAATVVILPELPASRPEPSAGLLRTVQRVIAGRRLVGSRIVVSGPVYLEVLVRARLRAAVGREPAAVADAARAALDAYFHPLTGGRNQRGWPFGRDVYRPEILGLLDAVDGVDYVVELELVGPEGETCANVCLPPTGLVAAGPSELTVEPAT